MNQIMQPPAAELSSVEYAHQVVENFKTLYQTLSKDTVHSGIIEAVYSENIHFIDSFHDIKGRDAFIRYCESIYENVKYSRFTFHTEMVNSQQAMLTWTMNYAHPQLKGGSDIAVKGASHIKIDKGVYFHQDFVDGGELLYDHIPVLGWILQKIKNRMI